MDDFTASFVQLVASGGLLALLVFAVRTAVDTIKTVVFGPQNSQEE